MVSVYITIQTIQAKKHIDFSLYQNKITILFSKYDNTSMINNIIKNDNVFDNEVYPWKVKAVSDSFDLSPAIWYKEDLK